jgi:hypothetical protein
VLMLLIKEVAKATRGREVIVILGGKASAIWKLRLSHVKKVNLKRLDSHDSQSKKLCILILNSGILCQNIYLR